MYTRKGYTVNKNTKLISSKLFLCNVPLIATYSEAELEVLGLPVTVQDGKMNKKTYNDTTTVMITVDRMIEMYSSGMPISVVKSDDAGAIYEILDNYLSGKDIESRSLNVVDDRDESKMEEADRFASEMFGYNKNTIVKQMVEPANNFGLGINLLKSPSNQIQASTVDMHAHILGKAPEINMANIKRTPIANKRRRVTKIR